MRLGLGLFGLFFILVLSFIVWNISLEFTVDTVENCKVTLRDRVVKSDGDGTTSYYLIHTDKEVFKNRDALFHGKFNSSDFQSKIELDSTYNFTVTGKRIPFLSKYRNIIEFEKSEQ